MDICIEVLEEFINGEIQKRSSLLTATSDRRVAWGFLPGIRAVGSFVVDSSVQILRLGPRVHVGVT